MKAKNSLRGRAIARTRIPFYAYFPVRKVDFDRELTQKLTGEEAFFRDNPG